MRINRAYKLIGFLRFSGFLRIIAAVSISLVFLFLSTLVAAIFLVQYMLCSSLLLRLSIAALVGGLRIWLLILFTEAVSLRTIGTLLLFAGTGSLCYLFDLPTIISLILVIFAATTALSAECSG
jgi:hypothetical protein